MVSEGTPGASVVAVRRVNELDYYSLGARQLAVKVGLTMPKLVAVVDEIGLRDDEDCYKPIKIGSSTYTRYSPKAIDVVKSALTAESAEDIWKRRKQRGKRAK